MTTTEPQKQTILDAMKRGRDYASTMVLVISFLHSMYASYFKPEEVAVAGYKATSTAIEDYSVVVRDEIETLKARINQLEAEADTAKKERVLLRNPPAKVRKPASEPVIVVEEEPLAQDIVGSSAPAPAQEAADPLLVQMPSAPWQRKKGN